MALNSFGKHSSNVLSTALQIHMVVSNFSDFLKPSTWLQSNDKTSNLVNWLILILMRSFL